MELLAALIAGIAALSGVYLQARIQTRREELAGKQAREDELFKLEFEKFKELEELLSLLVTASRMTYGRDMRAEERFDRLVQRLSLGFPNYDDLGEDLNKISEAYFAGDEGEVRFVKVKALSHEVIKNCRTALMYDFPTVPSTSEELQEARGQKLFGYVISTFFLPWRSAEPPQSENKNSS